jgi:CheY-like chemotaxis protein
MKLILVIEDDMSIRQSMQEALESEGYDVLTAENGKVGLEVLKQNPATNLILLDMMMPIMNGREFLTHVKSDVQLSSVPVIVISAIADDKNTIGAEAFMRKPTDLDKLFKLVAKYN